MNCKACGQPLQSEMKFCVHCGAPVPRADAEPVRDTAMPATAESSPAEATLPRSTPAAPPSSPPKAPPHPMLARAWTGFQAVFTGLGCLALVVVLIVGAARGRPVYRRAHEKEKMARCLERMMQLGRAARMYAQDYDGRFPLAENWADALLPYLRRRENFFCPARGGAFPYAFNKALSARSLKQIKSPRGTILFFDSEAGQWNAADTGASLPAQGRHNGCNVTGLVDGTALWQPARDKFNFDPARSFTWPHLPPPSPPGGVKGMMMMKMTGATMP